MPSQQRFPHARRRRRPAPRHLLILGALATIVAAGGLVIGPALTATTSAARLAPPPVSGQEPTPGGSMVPTGSPSPAPAASDQVAVAAPSPALSPSAAPSDAAGTPLPPPWITGRHAPDPATLTGYRWPLAHPRLTLPFGPTPWGSRLVDGQTFHDGIDLASFCSDKVLAAHDGVVIAAGRHYDRVMGWVGDLTAYFKRIERKHLWYALPIVVVIDDGNGYRSMYAHMWRLYVKTGDTVKAGDTLGLEGMTGRASGCHLHYGLFAPEETATFGIIPKVVKDMKLPALEIARIDPLSILPKRAGLNAPAKPKGTPEPGATPIP